MIVKRAVVSIMEIPMRILLLLVCVKFFFDNCVTAFI